MENRYILIGGITISIMLASSFILFDNNKFAGEDITFGFGISVDTLISIATSILAVILFLISVIAYKKDKRKRLLFVTGAFFLFAVKGFLIVSDELFPQNGWIEPVAHFLDFGILVLFFSGLVKK